MNAIESIAQIWEVLVGLVVVVAWLIRLESKVMYLEKDYERHKSDAAEKDKAFWAKLDSMQATLNLVLQAVGELKGRVEKK